MNKVAKFKAFSLIEMLLVISIVSVLMLLGYMLAYRYAEQVKVERTATQIKQLLEAGVSYYITNNQWPVYANPPPTDFKQYLSFDNLKNPWGQDYIYSVDGMKFVVVTTLPNSNLAERVTNLLTDAYLDSATRNKIIAEILVAPNYRPLSNFINEIGSFDLDSTKLPAGGGSLQYTIDVKPCPIGWKRNVVTAIKNIEFGTLLKNNYMPLPTSLGADNNPSCSDDKCNVKVYFSGMFCYRGDGEIYYRAGVCTPESFAATVSMAGPVCGGTQECTSASTDKVVAENGKIGFYYISYCKK